VSVINILIADNQPLILAGLQYIVNQRPDFNIAAVVTNAGQLEQEVSYHRPDVLIIDYNLSGYVTPGQLESVIKSSAVKTLVITADEVKPSIMKVVQMGVQGFLTKSCSKEEIIMAVQATARGEKFFCHKVLDMVLENNGLGVKEPNCEPTCLTQRETEILQRLAEGHNTKKIADLLNLSPHTVHTHRKNIIKKLNIKSPTEYVVYAIDFGLITPKNL
jgi:two-component system, NarL family, invasion response regulator UvrY